MGKCLCINLCPGGGEYDEGDRAMERMDKILSTTGRWSRREVKDLVAQGRVRVNEIQVKKSDEKYDPQSAHITVDGQWVDCAPFAYIMLHKPAGVVSATEDREKTVLDLLPQDLQRRGLFPVGRLDKDTEGLLLLTDDGNLAHRLLSPKKHVDKVYYAKVDGILTEKAVDSFQTGLVLGDGLHCLPAGLELLEEGTAALVTLREGKFHQVKRMLAACGAPVTYLKRLSMGGLQLDEGLKKGEFRHLTMDELERLKGS